MCPIMTPKLVPGVEEIIVKFLLPGGDSLLHISISHKLLLIQVLLTGSKETEITGCKIVTVGMVVHNMPAVVL